MSSQIAPREFLFMPCFTALSSFFWPLLNKDTSTGKRPSATLAKWNCCQQWKKTRSTVGPFLLWWFSSGKVVFAHVSFPLFPCLAVYSLMELDFAFLLTGVNHAIFSCLAQLNQIWLYLCSDVGMPIQHTLLQGGGPATIDWSGLI